MNKYFNKRKISRRDLVEYKLIGDGKDGEVYQLSHDKCVKIFFLEETQKRVESSSNWAIITYYSKTLWIWRKLYYHGVYTRNFTCTSLEKEKQITEELTERILIMLDELKKIGFTRWDTEVRHVLINEEGQLKVIDHKRAFTSNSEVPTKLLKGFKKFGLSQDFLNYVKNIRSSVYNRWAEHR